MKPLDTLPKLKQMLREAGFDAACPSPAVAWRVFQAYLDVPVQCEQENALFQVGDFSTEHKAYFDFCREFCLRAADDVVWHEQVHVEFTRAALPNWGRSAVQRWAHTLPSRNAFIREVESLPEFQAGLALSGWRSNVFHTGV